MVFGALTLSGTAHWYVATRDPKIEVAATTLPTPNAYDTYQKAISLLKGVEAIGEALPDGDGKVPKPLSLKEREALVAENAAALRLIREGLRQPYQEPPLLAPDGAMPYLAEYRKMARLLSFEGRVLAEKGDLQGATDAWLDAVELGQQITKGGALISRLVGIACGTVGRRPLWDHLEKLDTSTAKAATRRMEAILAAHVPYTQTLAEEKNFGLRALRVNFRDSGRMARIFRTPDSEEYERPVTTGEKLQINGLYMIWSKRYILDNYMSYMDASMARAGLPYNPQSGFTEIRTPTDPFNSMLLPVFDRARLKDVANCETANALLTVGLALRAYRVEGGGELPARLDDLCPAYLSRVPKDPFSSGFVDPLRYQPTEYSFTLYSVGPDGGDNDGSAIDDPSRTGKARHFVEADSRGDIVAGVNAR